MIHPINDYLKVTVRLLLLALIDWLLFLPIWILLEKYLLSLQYSWVWALTLTVLVVAGVLLRHFCSRRWKQIIAGLILGAAPAILFRGLNPAALPLTAAGFVCAFLGMTAGTRYNRQRIYSVGLTVYLIAAIVYPRIPELRGSMSLLTLSGAMCLVLALLYFNISHLRYSSFNAEGERLPAGIKRHNRLLVILFVVIAAATAAGAGRAVGLLIWNALRLIFKWLTQLLSGSGDIPEPESAPVPPITMLPQAETNEPGLLTIILDVLFYSLGTAAVLLLLFLALRWLYHNTAGWWRKSVDAILAMLRKQSSPEPTSFIDEETSVFKWESTVRSIRDYWRNKLLPVARRDRWEEAEGPRERVRWLYRHWLLAKQEDGYEPKAFLTPLETGRDAYKWAEEMKGQRNSERRRISEVPDDLIHTYNKARYSNEMPAEEVIIEMKKRLRL